MCGNFARAEIESGQKAFGPNGIYAKRMKKPTRKNRIIRKGTHNAIKHTKCETESRGEAAVFNKRINTSPSRNLDKYRSRGSRGSFSDSYRSAKTKIKSGSVVRMKKTCAAEPFFSMSGGIFDGGHSCYIFFGPCVFPCGRVSSTVQSGWNCFFQQMCGLSRAKGGCGKNWSNIH